MRNGGKQRAINEAMDLARGEFFFIVDSDDALAFNAISFIKHAFSTLPKDDNSFIGISGLKVYFDGSFIHQQPKIESSVGYIDCNNLERPQYALQADMAEAFYTEKLKQYKFTVWEGEIFTPEAVVWDQMALDGYSRHLPAVQHPLHQHRLSAGILPQRRDKPFGHQDILLQRSNVQPRDLGIQVAGYPCRDEEAGR